jgi:hypothetical protein
MITSIHPAAPHNLPSYITAPGETDTLMIVMGVILALSALAFGTLLLRLHHLPEHIAHKSQKVQFEIVAILGLIAMFTHMNIFWIAALLLALIDLPDFGTPLSRIADSAETIAGIKPRERTAGPAEIRTAVDRLAEASVERLPRPSWTARHSGDQGGNGARGVRNHDA